MPILPNPTWPGHNAWSDQVKALLGLGPKQKLPVAGLPPQRVAGIAVWVEPLSESSRRRRVHRVKAQCPVCHLVLSAGRLGQHRCR